jgi:hypothetical protein
MCTVSGAYPSGDTFGGIDADGKSRPQRRGVFRGLVMQRQRIALFRCQGNADQSAPVGSHKIDHLRRNQLSGADKIPFVLTILVIDQNDHPTTSQVIQNI